MLPSQWEHACFATDRAIDSNGVAVKKKVILMIISHYIHSGFLKYRLGSNSLNSVGDKFNDFSYQLQQNQSYPEHSSYR